MNTVLRSISRVGMLVLSLTAMAACADNTTAPVTAPAAAPTAPQKLIACGDPGSDPSCDEVPGGGGTIPATFLRYFRVTNCDPYSNIECAPYCDPYDQSCMTQQEDDNYFEIRQTLYEANGSAIEYQEQRWHSVGDVNAQAFGQSLCGAPGRYIGVEIYELHTFNIVYRKAAFIVNANENGVLKHVGNGITWSSQIKYSWTC